MSFWVWYWVCCIWILYSSLHEVIELIIKLFTDLSIDWKLGALGCKAGLFISGMLRFDIWCLFLAHKWIAVLESLFITCWDVNYLCNWCCRRWCVSSFNWELVGLRIFHNFLQWKVWRFQIYWSKMRLARIDGNSLNNLWIVVIMHADIVRMHNLKRWFWNLMLWIHLILGWIRLLHGLHFFFSFLKDSLYNVILFLFGVVLFIIVIFAMNVDLIRRCNSASVVCASYHTLLRIYNCVLLNISLVITYTRKINLVS